MRVKERKVYELAADARLLVSRITGRLLFPPDLLLRWLRQSVEFSGAGLGDDRPAVMAGSHDPLLEWALRDSGSHLAAYFDGSSDGLRRVGAGEAMACGVHLPDPQAGDWNVAAVRDALPGVPVVLLGWARRRQGLLLRPEDERRFTGLDALTGMRVVRRQSGAGSRALFERVLAAAGVDSQGLGWRASAARTESDVAMSVAAGEADAGFAIEAAARQMRLAFIPLAEKRFDLLVWRSAYFEPPLQRLWGYCAGAAYRERGAALGGYDLSGHGQVHFNGV